MAGDIIFEDGTIITPADLEKLIPLIMNALGATAKDPSEYPVLERLDDLTSLPVFDAGYNLGRVSILRLKGVNGKNAILRVQGDMLQWSLEGTDIWNDLYSKSDLKGDPGAAANMEIGEVTSGDTPAATITGEAPNYKLNLVLVPGGKGDTGDDGKTPILASVNAQSGETASGNFTDDGFDESGNPKYILDLTLPKGQDGQPAIFEQGTTTTLEPAEEARVEIVENGLTPEGNPKYLLNFFIPRGPAGPAGTGTGNVLVDATGLVIGKKYLFVPNADESTAGTFVEYTPPGNATAESAGLMTSDQFQKLEKVSPDDYVKKDGSTPFTNHFDVKASDSYVRFVNPTDDTEKGSVGGDDESVYLFNWSRRNFLKYTNAGKLLFEDKETFAVDADNELTLAGKKLSELGGGAQYLDLSPLFDSEGNLASVVTDEFLAQVEAAYNNRVSSYYVNGIVGSLSINSDTDSYKLSAMMFIITSSGRNEVSNGILDQEDILINKTDKSVLRKSFTSEIRNTGDGTKFKSDDGTYKDNIASATKLQTARNINGVSFDGTENISIGQLVPIMIKGGTDLNDFTTPGMYFNPSDAVTATIVNTPIAHAFSLLVEKHAGYKQTFTVYGDNFMQMFVRNYDGYSWSPWYKISLGTSTNISNLNVIPAGYDIVTCTLNTNTSITVENAGMAEYNGRTVSVYVLCGTTARTITIPTTGNYISMCGSSYTCPANKWVEFNLTCVDGKWHIAKLEQE